jgi:uncharacterized protein YacL (UPF0231 family)
MNKKDIIKNNGNNILKNENKYYYIIVSGGKPKILSASRSKVESKNETINLLNDKMDKIKENTNIKLYRLTIRKVTKEEKEDDKESSIDMVGGTLIIILEEIDVSIKNNKLKFQIDKNLDNGNKIFIDNKYLKKYNTISDKILKTISFKFSINKIDGGFTINKLSHFLI